MKKFSMLAMGLVLIVGLSVSSVGCSGGPGEVVQGGAGTADFGKGTGKESGVNEFGEPIHDGLWIAD